MGKSGTEWHLERFTALRDNSIATNVDKNNNDDDDDDDDDVNYKTTYNDFPLRSFPFRELRRQVRADV